MTTEKTKEYKRLWQKKWRQEHKAEASIQYKKDAEKYSKKYPEKVKARVAKAVRQWREKNPQKNKAHKIVFIALRNGTLEKQPCEYCIEKNWNVQAHHMDYSKPLDVVWLCKLHHRQADGWRKL